MKILGLDLGVGSIGWSVIETNENLLPQRLLGMGSRIVSLTPDESNNFAKGSGETICAQRTQTRTARKMLDRFQARRAQLKELLVELGMWSEQGNYGKNPLQIWQLRADAATPNRKLTLEEIGDVLRHMVNKRGYRHSKNDSSDSKQTQFVQSVNSRWAELQELNETPGQHAARLLRDSAFSPAENKQVYSYRIKDKNDRVLPRQAYEAEFDAIMNCQAPYYPQILTPENVKALKSAIFFQRPLKSCKHLVSRCEFESKTYIDKNGRKITAGPKVAPRTSPLAQLCHIYEAVNNITLINTNNKRTQKDINQQLLDLFPNENAPRDARKLQYSYTLTTEERQRIVEYLWTHEKMSESELLKLLGLKKTDGFRVDKNVKSGIKGNTTYHQLAQALKEIPNSENLLKFSIKLTDTGKVDQDTGEIIQEVDCSYMEEPLYKLWHLVYSCSTKSELAKNLQTKYGISSPLTIDALYAIDFTKPGFSNKSAKFMRRIIPHLMNGAHYSEAALAAGVNHSDSLTKEENLQRTLQDSLSNLKKGELRQPTVEKILNQMINVVNAVMQRWGRMDEIRVELARELKQSKEKRAEDSFRLSKRENENKALAIQLSEHGLKSSRRNIQKLRLHQETGGTCIYCGQPVGFAEFIGGHGAEVEHIIPRSLLFDDSFSNKACACRKCNQQKGQRTGYDYMVSCGEENLTKYINRVTELFKSGIISRTKRDRLLCEGKNIPTDFIDRDLRQSQYIAKKAREILRSVCYNVNASSGSVTDFFRHAWGYDMILHNLNLNRYAMADLVEDHTFTHNGQTHTEQRIANWTKRNDHRHHAIDALVIALTRQGYVQRLNNLSQQRDAMFAETNQELTPRSRNFHLLEEWAASRPHFPVSEVSQKTDEIAISFKPGKKLTTPGKRYAYKAGRRHLVQTDLKIPRGALHQETIYGKIKIVDGPKKLKDALKRPDLIIDGKLRAIVAEQLLKHGNDIDKLLTSLKKNPLTHPVSGEKVTTIDCFREEYVRRVDVNKIEYKNIGKILDKAVREAVKHRYDECNKNTKLFEQSLSERPITIGNNPPREVKTVRCSTGLTDDKMVGARLISGNIIGYAKSGNNHHVAFYATPDGKVETHVASFWICVKRQKLGLPIIITDPQAAADQIISLPSSTSVEEVAASLPLPDRTFRFSLQMNEMVILGLTPEQIADARATNDYQTLCRHLYRVQKLAMGDYVFRQHTHTQAAMEPAFAKMELYKRITSLNAIKEQNLTKVRVNCLGEITFPND